MQNNFYFINNHSNIYKKPSKQSEVTSQIIYGEKFKILTKNKNDSSVISSEEIEEVVVPDDTIDNKAIIPDTE